MALVNIPFGYMATQGGYRYLLDWYGTDAKVALSVRKLSSTYTGSAIEVTRTSDSTTQDIGFDSNNNLDTGSIATFCTGSTCKVTKWYDQTGNDNWFGDDNGPTVYENNTLQTSRNLPTLNFNPSTYSGEALHYQGAGTGQFDFTGSYSYYVVTTTSPIASGKYILGSSDAGSKPAIITNFNTEQIEFYGGTARETIAISASVDDVQQIGLVFDDFTGITGSYSGSQVFTAFENNFAKGLEAIGGSSPSGDFYQGKMSELILYVTDQTLFDASIKQNQNDYFNMY